MGVRDRAACPHHGGVLGHLDTAGPGRTWRAAALADFLCDRWQLHVRNDCATRKRWSSLVRLAGFLAAAGWWNGVDGRKLFGLSGLRDNRTSPCCRVLDATE